MENEHVLIFQYDGYKMVNWRWFWEEAHGNEQIFTELFCKCLVRTFFEIEKSEYTRWVSELEPYTSLEPRQPAAIFDPIQQIVLFNRKQLHGEEEDLEPDEYAERLAALCAHEVCHFKYQNHGIRTYDLQSKVSTRFGIQNMDKWLPIPFYIRERQKCQICQKFSGGHVEKWGWICGGKLHFNFVHEKCLPPDSWDGTNEEWCNLRYRYVRAKGEERRELKRRMYRGHQIRHLKHNGFLFFGHSVIF